MEKEVIPSNLIESPDRRMIYMMFAVSLAITIRVADPFLYFHGVLNESLLRAIPLPIGIMTFSLPIIAYYSLNIMERFFYVDLEKMEVRREELKLKKQKLTFMSRYRSSGRSTVWEITNRSTFGWTNAKLLIERTFDGVMETEKHQINRVAMMSRLSVTSKLEPKPGSQWRVMILAEEGNAIDYPERQASLDYEH